MGPDAGEVESFGEKEERTPSLRVADSRASLSSKSHAGPFPVLALFCSSWRFLFLVPLTLAAHLYFI